MISFHFSTERADHSAVVLHNGLLILVGGAEESDDANTLEIVQSMTMIFESGKVLDNYHQQHTAINHISFGTGGIVIEPPTGGGHGTCAVAYQSGFVTIGGYRAGIHSQVDRFHVVAAFKERKKNIQGIVLQH